MKKNIILVILFIIFFTFLCFAENNEEEKKIYIKNMKSKLFEGDKIDWDNKKLENRFNGWEDVDSNVFTMQYYSSEASAERFEKIKLDIADGIHPVFMRKSYGRLKDGRYIVADFELTTDKGEILTRILKTYNKEHVNYDDFETKTTVYSFERIENYKYLGTFMVVEEYENVRTDPVNSEILDERTPLKPKGIIKEYDKNGNLIAKILRITPELQVHRVYLTTEKLYKIEVFNGVHEKLRTLWKEKSLTADEKKEAATIEEYEKGYIYFLKNR